MHNTHSGKIALCGMMGALAMVVMLMGNVVPFATFCAPALAGLLLLPPALECGTKAGLTLYAAVGLLCVLFLPDREMACFFVFVLGYYPQLRERLARLHPAPLRWVVKLAVFNAALALMYAVLLVLFPVKALVQEYQGTGRVMLLTMLGLFNLTFVIFDLAVANLKRVYLYRLRPRLTRFL